MPDQKLPILIFVGGHHTSGLEVAKILLANHKINIVWIGHRYSAWGDSHESAEYHEVTNENIPFIALRAGKFHHTYNPIKLIRIPWGFIQSMYILIRLKLSYPGQIRGVVSFGGYLAVPVVICAWMLNIPSLTHEQTAVSGWANRLIAIFCRKIAISWSESIAYLPKNKCIYVGLPIRQALFKTKRSVESAKPTIYITGGKQGSHVINQSVFQALPQLLERFDVIHQTGSNSQYADYKTARQIQHPRYSTYEYADAKTTAANIQKSRLVISRSGAHTIAELLFFHKKSVLIPIPWGSHNEQEKNANMLKNLNLAVVLDQQKLNPQTLLRAIDACLLLKPQKTQFNFHGLKNYASLIDSEFLQ